MMDADERKLMIQMAKTLEEGLKTINATQLSVLQIDERVAKLEHSNKAGEFFNGTRPAVVATVQKSDKIEDFKMDIHFRNSGLLTAMQRSERSMRFMQELIVVMERFEISRIKGEYIRNHV